MTNEIDDGSNQTAEPNPGKGQFTALVDLPLEPKSAELLLKSRWQAEIQVRIPAWLSDVPELRAAIEHTLRGREPITVVQEGALSVLFLTEAANDQYYALLNQFVEGLVIAMGITEDDIMIKKIAHPDIAEEAHLVNPELRPLGYDETKHL